MHLSHFYRFGSGYYLTLTKQDDENNRPEKDPNFRFENVFLVFVLTIVYV